MKKIKDIAARFTLEGNIDRVFPFGSGHINDSYKVETDREHYLLQRVNHNVFKDVEGLTRNLIAVTSHLQDRAGERFPPMQAVQSIPAADLQYTTRDHDGNFWRVLRFVGGSHSYDRVPGPEVAMEGGKAYGWFIRMLSDFPVDGLAETIPDFHNAEFRIRNFEKAVADDPAGRFQQVKELVDQLMARAASMKQIFNLGKAGRIPLRVTHNDTKINNVLFNEQDKGICVIDLDTVMPGYVHFDFGDAIRTFANTGDEDEADPGSISFNLEYFKAFTAGFLSQTRPILNETELLTLALGPPYITYEQTIRFLTDYLEGDPYYKIRYPGHNLVRSRAQFRLLECMESSMEEMERIITS